MPDLRQAAGRAVPAVLLEALCRCRSQPLALRRLRGAGDRERRRGRRQGRPRPGRPFLIPAFTITRAVLTLPWRGRVGERRSREPGWGEAGEVHPTPPPR